MNINSASLIELKAELQRASERASNRGAGSSSGSSYTKLNLKGDSISSRKTAQETKAQVSTSKNAAEAEPVEDARIVESRKKLEMKARQYEEMQSKARELITTADSDSDTELQLGNCAPDKPLVDFEQKALLDFAHEREREKRIAAAKLTSVDKALRNPKFDSTGDADAAYRDRMREKWDRDAEKNEAKLDTDGKLHYQDVRFDEIREHGAGYFEFARDAQVRASQQEELQKMRTETEASKRKRDFAKLERERKLKERLEAVKRLRLSRKLQSKASDSSEQRSGSEESEDEECHGNSSSSSSSTDA